MKYKINGFLIVEGTSDRAFLSTFLDCEIIWVGGNALPRGTMDYIQQLSLVSQPIILTDPDIAGRRIQARLEKALPNAQSALISLNPLQIGKKNGVAESTKQEILRVLKPFITDKENVKGIIKESELIGLGLSNKTTREYLANTLKIGMCNLKSLTNRLNYLNIDINKVKRIVKAYGNQ